MGQGRYNQTRKLYRGGTKVREERPTAEHFTYDTPAIIERDLWDAVTARFDSNEGFRATQGNATRGPAPKYLLTGLARCGCCGGPIMVGRRKRGRENINVYSCGWRRDRGAAVCSNKAVAPVVEVDAAVIEGVRRYITPDVATEVLRQVRAILKERRPMRLLSWPPKSRSSNRRLHAICGRLERPTSLLTYWSQRSRTPTSAYAWRSPSSQLWNL